MVMISAGAPKFASAMILAVFSNFSGGLTHYGTGSAPIYYSAGYLSLKEWWTVGFIVAIFNIIVFSGTAGVYWKAIGYL